MQDVAGAALYLAAKPSAYSIYPRLLLTAIEHLSHYSSDYSLACEHTESSRPYPQGAYELARNRLYEIEAHMLRVLGFQIHVALPHTLSINYLQALEVFNTPEGRAVARRAIELLNTAFFSPQLLYLTHQPNSLAVSAIYLAARQVGVKLPETEWWEVFDVDREDLGFIVVALLSVKNFVTEEAGVRSDGKSLLTVEAVKQYMHQRDLGIVSSS